MEQEQRDEYCLDEYLCQTKSMLSEMNESSLAASTAWFRDEDASDDEQPLGSWSSSNAAGDEDENLPPCPSGAGQSFEWQDPSDCSSSEDGSCTMLDTDDASVFPVLSRTDMISSWWRQTTAPGVPVEYYETVEASNLATNDERSTQPRTRWCYYCACLGGGQQQSNEKKFLLNNNRNKSTLEWMDRLLARFKHARQERRRRLVWGRKNKKQGESSSSPLLEAGSW